MKKTLVRIVLMKNLNVFDVITVLKVAIYQNIQNKDTKLLLKEQNNKLIFLILNQI